MQFCKQCGTPIAILHDKEAIFCPACASASKTPQTRKNENALSLNLTEISGFTFTTENNKILLKSKEGWLLWSGESTTPHNLETILSKAVKIHRIRKRQKQIQNKK